MPTTGWIQDSANDSWSEYLSTLPHEKRLVRCPYCVRKFEDAEKLRAHIGLDHPLEIPGMCVQGNPAPSVVVVRHRASVADFTLFNCTACIVRVGGKELSFKPSELAGWLAETQPVHADVWLENERPEFGGRVHSEVRIEFRIASSADLERCDQEFRKLLARPSFRMYEVEAFVKSVPQHGASREYSGALADYAIGVLLKDQEPTSGIVGSLHEHKDKFMSALEVLSGLSRPVARAIESAIAFNLNAWDRLQPPAELPAFIHATEFFRLLEGFKSTASNSWLLDDVPNAICPIDGTTGGLLRAIRAIPETAAGSVLPEAITTLFKEDADSMLTEFDLVKRSVIRAVAALRLREKAAAKRALTDVRHDHHFGAWAEARLQELN